MSSKYKLTVIALVIVAAAAVIILTNQDPVSNDEVGTGQIAEEGQEFAPATDPYQAYLDARDAGRPIVLEFYARW